MAQQMAVLPHPLRLVLLPPPFFSHLSFPSPLSLWQGTFYGAGGAGKAGACMLNPGFNGVGLTVAMNSAQFDGGMSCGKCIMATGTGSGLGTTPLMGPIYATIDNLCPECKYGDVDFGLGGDGRWQINWDFIDCGTARASGSSLPSKQQGGGGRRTRLLRGTFSEDEETTWLQPGEMVTKDGIVKLVDYLAGAMADEGKEDSQGGAGPASATSTTSAAAAEGGDHTD